VGVVSLPGTRTRWRSRPRVRRLAWWGGGLALAALIGAASLAAANEVRRDLNAGRGRLVQAERSLLAGDIDAATRDFTLARRDFARAEHHPANLLLKAEAIVPFAGRTPGAVLSLASIGQELAGDGVQLSRAVAALPQGLSSLGPVNGRIPIETLQSLGPVMHRTLASLVALQRRADRLPDSFVLGQVAQARELVRAKLDQAVPLARSADALLASLPTFAGVDHPRHYFLAAQNTAELRGTGGLIGNYAILTLDDGRMSLGPFRDTGLLRNLPASKAPSPSADFEDLYGPFGGAGFWLNVNMTPDAPTAATMIERLYQQVEGTPVDGAIFFDLQGLSDLLRTTGPVRVPALHTTLTSSSVVPFVSTAAYLEGDVPNAFQEGPRLVAEAVWNRFLAVGDAKATLEALVRSASAGHLMLHATDPSLERAFRLAGVAGAFGPDASATGAADRDFFALVLSNAAGNKVDAYLQQDVRYEVVLDPNGGSSATATVKLTNGAPAGSAPSYALGPYPGLTVDGRALAPGEDRSWAQFYCAGGCDLTGSTQDGKDVGLEAHRELGLPVFASFLDVSPRSSTELRLGLHRQKGWDGDATGGVYRLRLQGQATIRPTTVTLEIHAPPGMQIVWTNVPMTVRGGVATWRGTLGTARDFEVRFHRPFVSRVWTRIRLFLDQPAIRF
jgi:hypothetical protein